MSDKGGSAFPHEAGRTNTGMTLRDYFAAKAMEGMLFGCVGLIGNSTEVSAYAKGHCNAAVAKRAYAIADEMLAERAK